MSEYGPPKNSLTGIYDNEPELIDERILAIRGILIFHKNARLINESHFNRAIDLFAYVGTGASALRALGASGLTLVEKDPDCQRVGLQLGHILSSDYFINDYPQNFISDFAKTKAKVTMITGFGTHESYFNRPFVFLSNAMNCLVPGGALLMSGTVSMGKIFTLFSFLHGGTMTRGSIGSHSWDTYRYCVIKK